MILKLPLLSISKMTKKLIIVMYTEELEDLRSNLYQIKFVKNKIFLCNQYNLIWGELCTEL
jgi:hypothetical protein